MSGIEKSEGVRAGQVGALDAGDAFHPTMDSGVDVELVPQPRSCTGNLGADLAIMLIEAGREDRKISQAMRESEERMQEAAEAAQIEAMEDKSDAAYAAGLAGGFATAGSGVLKLAGGLNPGSKNVTEGSATALEGTGKVLSAVGTHEASDAETEATKALQLASRHARSASDARDQEKAADGFIDRVTDLYKEYLRTQQATQQAAILRA